MTKKCAKCGIPQALSSFSKNQSQCKGCNRAYRSANADRIKSYMKTKRKKRERPLSEAEKEKAKIYYAKYKLDPKNITKARERASQWRLNNRDKYNEYQLNWSKKQKLEKPSFKIARNLRTRMYCALKRQYKNGSAVNDLGCTVKDLMIYLESKFTDGMNWDNYGQWHIDHIIPLSSFQLTDRNEFIKAAHYTNLQPMWGVDNLKKGNRI